MESQDNTDIEVVQHIETRKAPNGHTYDVLVTSNAQCRPSGLAIVLHGGAFASGSNTYDKALVQVLVRRANLCVMQPNLLDGRVGLYPCASDQIQALLNTYEEEYPDQPQVLVGVSSGAFTALHVWRRQQDALTSCALSNLVIGIAPVIDPAERHDRLSSVLKKRQLHYFGDLTQMRQVSDYLRQIPPNWTQKGRIVLFPGAKDTDRAPPAIANKFADVWGSSTVSVQVIPGDHGTLCKGCPELFDAILEKNDPYKQIWSPIKMRQLTNKKFQRN